MDKRTKLILTAKRLFSEHGFYGTATARIAREAGVSNGILFHYFPTKDLLIKAMFFDVKDRLFDYSVGQVYKGATLKESIYTLWLAAIEFNLENANEFEFIRQFETSPFYRTETELEHRYVQLCLELIDKGIDEGQFKQIPAMLIFKSMSAQVETTVRFLKMNNMVLDDVEFTHRLFEMAWDSLAK